MGPENEVIFLVINLTKSCQKKRLQARHGDGEDDQVKKGVEVMTKGLYSVLW